MSAGDDPPLPATCTEEHRGQHPAAVEKQPAEQLWSVKEAFQARLRELKLKYKHVPERYRGYEALLDIGGDGPADNLPQGILFPYHIQGCVAHSACKYVLA